MFSFVCLNPAENDADEADDLPSSPIDCGIASVLRATAEERVKWANNTCSVHNALAVITFAIAPSSRRIDSGLK